MWDVFISHASEDKDAVARPLHDALQERGIGVWYDEHALDLGDSLLSSIEHGVMNCHYGVVILSRDYIDKAWTRRELEALLSREANGNGRKIVLPVRHCMTTEEVRAFSPIVASRRSLDTADGLHEVVDAIERLLRATGEPLADAADELVPPIRLSNNAERVLTYTLHESIAHLAYTPGADDVMQALGLTAGEYADAIKELAAVGLVGLQGNANHASGFARARMMSHTLVQYQHKLADIDLSAELTSLVKILGAAEGRRRSEQIIEQMGVPVSRLQWLIQFLKDVELLATGGPGRPDGLLFMWAELTPKGRRVARGLEPIPLVWATVKS